MRTKEKKKLQVKMNDVITSIGDVVASTGCRVLYSSYSDNKIEIEQNRCAIACQGCGAVFLLFQKRQ